MRKAGFLLQKVRNRSERVKDACAGLIIAASNYFLPYRRCQTFREFLLKLAGVRIQGRCRIRGPIYVQYPRRLSIGAGVTINGHVHFENAGTIEIGANSAIGPGSMFFTMMHRGGYPRTNEPLGIRIGERVLCGGAVRILPGVTIGDDAVVLTGSVVASDVAPGGAVASVPARPVARPKS